MTRTLKLHAFEDDRVVQEWDETHVPNLEMAGVDRLTFDELVSKFDGWTNGYVYGVLESDGGVAARKQTLNDERVGHRDPFPHEVKAATDFAVMQTAWEGETRRLTQAWRNVRAAQIDDLVLQVAAAVRTGSPQGLARIAATALGAELIEESMLIALEEAAEAARGEAAAQGVVLDVVSAADALLTVREQAQAVAQLMARGISESAARQALLRYGAENLDPEAVGEAVREHLEGLSDRYIEDQLGGALTQAQNHGRRLVMGQVPAQIYASELLDQNTCSVCAGIDGREYDSLAEALQDYPTGGHKDCLGGPRCRGTLVAVYTSETAPVAASIGTGPEKTGYGNVS